MAAVRKHDNAVVMAASEQAAQDDPNNITLIHPARIRSISDVLCGDKQPDNLDENPPVIFCKFTVRYWDWDAYTVARMVRKSDAWAIDDALEVTRDRR